MFEHLREFYQKHEDAIDFVAGAGTYVVGCVVMAKATTVVGVATGAVLVIGGAVSASAAGMKLAFKDIAATCPVPGGETIVGEHTIVAA